MGPAAVTAPRRKTEGRKPVKLGTVVKPWGKVGAVLMTTGERYYHLIGRGGVVSMMPADVVERNAEEQA